jgi:hypothetical protein
MDRDATERVIQRLLAASGALNETVRMMQADAPDVLFQAYRKRTADGMAAIYLELLKPIYRETPSDLQLRTEAHRD